MRELYNEFFYIPKHGKIREKVMLTRIVSTIAIVIMCLAAMSITAYAYFSYNITSGSNTIKAASFYTDVTVQITDANGNEVEVITSDYVSHLAKGLEANKTYFVTLKHTERSTSQTGFVIVTATGCDAKYHTQQLGRDGDGKTLTITFTITPGATTDVTFYSHWGTSSYYGYAGDPDNNIEEYIFDGEAVELVIGGAKPSKVSGQSENATGQSGETTTTPTTDTTTPTTGTESSTPTTDTTTSETTGTSEPTNTIEPSSSETETTTQTTEPAATETTSTEATTETQPATENEETTGATSTEASE